MTEAKKCLDISETVSDEEYRAVLSSLLEQFEDWRRDHGWCTDLYHHVAQLTRTFRWNRQGVNPSIVASGYSGAMELDIPETRDGAERAQDLREVRGRILRFTRDMPDYLTQEMANQFLTTAGLAGWVPSGNRRYGVEFSGTLDTALTREEIEKKVRALFTKLGVTGHVGIYIRDLSSTATIPAGDTAELLPRR